MPDDRPDALTATDVDGLRADTRGLAESIDRLADRQSSTETTVEGKADTTTVGRLRRQVIATSVVAAVAVAALVATFLNNRDRIDQIVATRTSTRAAACAQDNIRIDQHNALADSLQTILDLVNVPRPTATAEQQATAAAFFAESRAAVDRSRVVNRDCTTAGIDAYYTTTTIQG